MDSKIESPNWIICFLFSIYSLEIRNVAQSRPLQTISGRASSTTYKIWYITKNCICTVEKYHFYFEKQLRNKMRLLNCVQCGKPRNILLDKMWWIIIRSNTDYTYATSPPRKKEDFEYINYSLFQIRGFSAWIYSTEYSIGIHRYTIRLDTCTQFDDRVRFFFFFFTLP